MTVKKTLINEQASEFAPTPTMDLKGKEGMRLLGILKKKVKDGMFPKKRNYLIQVEETDGSTTLYNKSTKENDEVDINVGDHVWLRGSVVLDRALKKLDEDTKVEVVYKGKGEAKPGQRAPFLYDIFKVGE